MEPQSQRTQMGEQHGLISAPYTLWARHKGQDKIYPSVLGSPS